MSAMDNSGRAVIEDGAIVIRVPIAYLPIVVEGAWASGYFHTRWKLTNPDEFAAELMNELNAESEDGTTRIHRMFDGAIEEAIEQGALGIEEHERQHG
jgi:hypothetical protein